MFSRRVSIAAAVLSLSIPAAVAAHPAARPSPRRLTPPVAEPTRLRPALIVPPAGQPAVTYTAHRGGALEVPENSMSGLAVAFRRHDAQVLDFDTRMLRDGTLVVMHDATLDRTTDRTGPVRDLTAAQWRTVRLRPAASLRGDWRPERPPTVAEALDRFGGRITLMVEAKDPESLPRLATMIRDRGLIHSVYVNTNRPEVAREAHRAGLLTQLWRSARQLRTDTPRDWRGTVDLLDVDYRARDTDVRRAVASGIPRVWAHTVDTPAQRDRMLRLGCDGIITDAPARLAATPIRPARTRDGG
ncbi:glycerophosphodiester phosphodiesterase family protein [Streptomyces luomodiensis]|uniref:Glycerophosphodiester phosphodiesterase family protein n=1 Tax=Streptomyces luomodiensis TaxID=3026192 RepID=A0ABY9UWF9_9ACTN|nr:glycerophosphodiester phosphodiesterase family protein [Streptomyces sp. SCA4-21]WNE96195.1 glycerophosphodiester phosphodiesterase family protein [Streptomyces sp. SCA4-21]